VSLLRGAKRYVVGPVRWTAGGLKIGCKEFPLLGAAKRHRGSPGKGYLELQRFFPDYIAVIDVYLQDEQTSVELLRPFTDRVPDPILDSRLLDARWQALGLPTLPEGFNAERACLWYVEELNKKRQAIDVLRPLWQAQADQRQN
jgi:hypothetical protein